MKAFYMDGNPQGNPEPGIIQSLLDTDYYKITMAQAAYHRYPGAWVRYHYQCRKGQDLPPGREREFLDTLAAAVDHLCGLAFSGEELAYLRSQSIFKPGFLEYLRHLRLNRDYVTLGRGPEGGLDIVVEGPWCATIFFEVPLLAIVSECHTRFRMGGNPDWSEGRRRLTEKIRRLREYNAKASGQGIRFVDFGTRRRAAFAWQDELVGTLAREMPEHFTGTSNVHLARVHGIAPIGTMAHEFVQAHQQLGPSLAESQKAALQAWMDEYRGRLGIALSDTIGHSAFLRDFDLYFAKLYDGCRHDSGDPFAWGENMAAHYERLGIDPATKRAVFSDGLTVEKMETIHEAFGHRMQVGFGIGTNLTNDVGVEPLDIVIKMVEADGSPVAKISDSPGKQMCEDAAFLRYLGEVFRVDEDRLRQDMPD